MKNLSKLLSVLLCLAMVLGIFAMVGSAAAGDVATLVSDPSTLSAGDNVIIVGTDGGKYYAINTTSNNNNRRASEVNVSDNTITIDENIQVFTVGTGTVDGSITFSNDNGYLCAASSSSNHLKFESTASANSSFKWIEGYFVAQGSYTRNSMRFNPNNGSPMFSCYASTSSVSASVSIYKISAADPGSPTLSLDKTSAILDKSGTITLEATKTNISENVTWSSDNTAVADVDQTGKVTATTTPGTATITATAGGKTATCVVHVKATTTAEIFTVANALAKNASMPYAVEMEAVVSKIVVPYNSGYANVTVNISYEGKPDTQKDIQLYRLKDTDSAKGSSLGVGDVIKVSGTVKDNNGTLEIYQGRLLAEVTNNAAAPTQPTNAEQVVNDAYALATGEYLPYNVELTGKVLIDGSKYYIIVGDLTDKKIQCYNLSGTGKDSLQNDDVITVSGPIKNYNDTIEFDGTKLVSIHVTGVTVDPTTAELKPTETVDLAATVTPDYANDVTITWSSDKESVATVDQNGKVTAVGVGTATITVTTTDGSKTAVCTVTVALPPVESVTMNPTTANIVVGAATQLGAAVTPSDADNTITWTSSKESVATVDNTGKVTAVAVGTATITATSSNGKTATCEVTIVAATVPATGVTLDKSNATVKVGETVTLAATVAPADSTDNAVWTTSDAAVATVNGGIVTAVAPGTATITATAGDKSATCTITVAANVSKVELDKTTANMTVGDETTLTATVTVNPNADTYKNVTWTTSDATVATVENGKVKALKAGTVTITATSATDNTKKAECAITIAEPASEGKITSLDQLVTGTYVLVVDSGYAAGALDGTWVSAVQPTIADDKVTDAKGGIWTLTVNEDGTVTITDANGKFIAPKGGNNNGIKEGEYSWTVSFADGKFTFTGNGDDTVTLASNATLNEDYTNKFRAYKNTTVAGDNYYTEFTLYAVASTGTGSGSGSTGNENTGSGSTGNENTGSGSTGNENTGSGNTDTGNKDESAKTELTKQDAPTAGKSFKLGLYQDNLKKNLYFAGATTDKDYYLATTEDPKEAVDVTVEAVEGGYRMYFTKDGVKTYLDVHKSGNYVNLRLTDEPTAVWTWNEEYKTFVADVEGETYYCGTYDKYSSLSASKLSYAATSFTSGLYLDQPSSTGDTFEPMVIILALAAVSALAVLALNKKKFSF